jgi:hypothetical protein
MAPSAVPINGESHEGSPIHSDSEAPRYRFGGPVGSGTNETNGAHGANGSNGVNLETEKLAPIAIVGMGCRLPGDVSSPEEFWELCSRARSGCKLIYWTLIFTFKLEGLRFDKRFPNLVLLQYHT